MTDNEMEFHSKPGCNHAVIFHYTMHGKGQSKKRQEIEKGIKAVDGSAKRIDRATWLVVFDHSAMPHNVANTLLAQCRQRIAKAQVQVDDKDRFGAHWADARESHCALCSVFWVAGEDDVNEGFRLPS